jgi:flagellin
VTSSTESAASLASAVNKVAGTTGVRAVASNKISAFFAAAKPGSGYAFTLQASQGGSNGLIGTAQSFAAGSTAGLVSQINGRSSATGITASWTPFAKGSGLLNLSQSSGENIALSALTEPGLAVAVTAIYQGHVQLQSSASFSVGNGAAIGLEASSTLTPLSDIDVGTVAGANTAINVVKYALARLGDQAGQLGAAQQALVATTDTLDTSSQNLSSALGVVQDANIPAVSQGLTQAQIAAQAGVAALKSSTALQQSFLSLLP